MNDDDQRDADQTPYTAWSFGSVHCANPQEPRRQSTLSAVHLRVAICKLTSLFLGLRSPDARTRSQVVRVEEAQLTSSKSIENLPAEPQHPRIRA